MCGFDALIRYNVLEVQYTFKVIGYLNYYPA